MRRGLLLSLMLLGAQPLTADAGEYYWGLMLGNTTFKQSDSEFEVGTATARLGYRLNSYLGAEVRGGMALGTDEAETTTGTVEFDMSTIGSAYVKLMWSPVDDHRIELYALGGYSTAEMEATGVAGTASATKSGVSYGVGVDLYASNQHGIFFEYTRQLETDWGADFTLDHVGLGYLRYF